MAAAEQIRSHAGLRGVAALLVVGYHMQFGTAFLLPFERATALFQRSYLMVDLFFVLSGFIIAYVNRADRPGDFPRGEYRDFLIRRLIRLYPLLLTTLLALLAFRLAAQAIGAHSAMVAWDSDALVLLAAQATMLNAWLPDPDGWNTPSWSISAEIVAYALFPLVVTLHARRRRLALALLCLPPLLFYGRVATTGGSLDIIGGLAPLRCVAGFALGMLLFHGRHATARRSDALLALAQIVAVAAIALLLVRPANDVAIIPVFALLVWSCWPDRGPVARLLARRPLQWLGEISYAIYLTHVPVAAMLGLPFGLVARHLQLDPGTARMLWWLAYPAAVLVVSHLCFHHIEAPARRWLTPRLTGRPATPIARSPAAP